MSTKSAPGLTFELGDYLPEVNAAIAKLDSERTVERIWNIDHTAWSDDPREITNRLGWLDVMSEMAPHANSLAAFSSEVRAAGIRDVVLLGMGGSSLGPEVLSQVLGSAPGYPALTVLDSTIPARVREVRDAIDPATTLFLVSSKSGSTIEPNMLYLHFRREVEIAVGAGHAGSHFAAITDSGSVLERIGREAGFRKVFLNPEQIGGRYSVLSYFGLVPAALIGANIGTLLNSSTAEVSRCQERNAIDNPGAVLGAIMGTLAGTGRDKLTLITSPKLASLGVWFEQLLAESTGKAGKGIIPVAREPILSAASYGSDRLFVYVRLDGDANDETDSIVDQAASAGHPVVRMSMSSTSDLGAQFYRWEFATAVAGALMRLNPFDQPNVESAKQLAAAAIQQFEQTGKAPKLQSDGSMRALLDSAKPGDYLAIMAYLSATPETDAALQRLRRKVTEQHDITTTLGYGPRFLHSTGQQHKGGPNSGLFLQITADHNPDVAIPGKSFTFGVLADAQADGDYEALREAGRRVARIHLAGGASQLVSAL